MQDAYEKDNEPSYRDVRADRTDEVPACERIRIIYVTPIHASEAQEMMREERKVHANKHQPEMQLPQGLAGNIPSYLRKPIVPSCEDREDCCYGEHIVKMGDHVV